jgi:MFS family permease
VRALLSAGLATGPLRRLQAGWASVSIGGWAFMVALAVYAYGEGGVAAVGLAAVVRMLPAGIAAPFAGVLADRMPRRTILSWVTGLRAAVLAGVAAAVAAGVPFAFVLALAAVFTVLQTAHRPAQAALIPHLARTPTQCAAANAVVTGVDNAAFLVGSLLGGVLVAATSAQAGFAVTAGTLALGAVILRTLPVDPVPPHRQGGAGVPAELAEGVRAIHGEPGLRLVVGVLATSTFVEGFVDVLVVVAAIEVVMMGDAGVGWLNAAWGLGGLAGGGVALMLLGRNRLASGVAIGACLAGVPLVALAGVPEAAMAVVALVVLGVGYAVMEVAGWTLLQRLPADDVLARTTSVMESAYWVTTGVGALLAPLLVSVVGGRWSLAIVGVALPVLVVARRAALGRLESGRPVPERPFALLRGLSVFAPLPLGTVENLALRAREVRASPGDRVVVEGDAGDRFYAVAEGRLQITREGSHRDSVAAGDFFGEIALLRDTPRNATVAAVEPCVLYALDRELFLEAVGAHARAGAAAQEAAAASSWGVPERV